MEARGWRSSSPVAWRWWARWRMDSWCAAWSRLSGPCLAEGLGGDAGVGVGTFGDEGDARVGGQAIEETAEGRGHVGEVARAEGAELVRGDAGSVEEQLIREADEG